MTGCGCRDFSCLGKHQVSCYPVDWEMCYLCQGCFCACMCSMFLLIRLPSFLCKYLWFHRCADRAMELHDVPCYICLLWCIGSCLMPSLLILPSTLRRLPAWKHSDKVYTFPKYTGRCWRLNSGAQGLLDAKDLLFHGAMVSSTAIPTSAVL